jgi:hypothetical protein
VTFILQTDVTLNVTLPAQTRLFHLIWCARPDFTLVKSRTSWPAEGRPAMVARQIAWAIWEAVCSGGSSANFKIRTNPS